MAKKRVERRLVAILAADMVGYSRLIGSDEAGTLARQKALHEELVDPLMTRHGGRLVKTTGDGVLIEFPSIVDAVSCAAEFQGGIASREENLPPDRQIAYRIGISLGDVVSDGDDILGDGVVLAARLEQIAEPGDIFISEDAFRQMAGKTGFTFEDMGAKSLKNVERPVRVYRLRGSAGSALPRAQPPKPRRLRYAGVAIVVLLVAAGIAIWRWEPFSRSPSSAQNSNATYRSDKASVALLPLRNVSGDKDQELFVKGLTTDINAALSRVPGLLVISQNTMARYRGKTVDVKSVARRLDVEHVLSGDVQRSGQQLRITMQLAKGDDGTIIWSGRYDRDVAELFKMQDEIVRNVLIEMRVKLTTGEFARLEARGTKNLKAWLLSVRANAEVIKFNRDANLRGRELFTEAARADPNWHGPLSGIAWTYREALRRGWSTDREADLKRGIELANKVIKMAPKSADGYIQLGNLYIESGRVKQGIALREKALELEPNNFWAGVGLAWQLIFVGEVKRSLALYARAKRVSPLHPGWLIASEAFALHVDGQHTKAISAFKLAISKINFPILHGRLAAVYAEIGQMEDARQQVRMLLEKKPNAKISDLTRILNFQDPKRTEWYVRLLRKAGVPE